MGWMGDGALKTHIICMCLLKSYVVSKSNLLRKFVSGVNWDRNLEKAVSRLLLYEVFFLLIFVISFLYETMASPQ